jgi:hypothetical protein
MFNFFASPISVIKNSNMYYFRPLKFVMLQRVIIFLVFWVSAHNLNAQTITEVYGKVIDAQSKEPLDYVTIRLKGTGRTVTTNPFGEYKIRFIEKSDTITFSYLGYKTREIAVRRNTTQELNIEMGSYDLELKEITVKAGRKKKREIDTTANYVYYQVIKNKKFNRESALNTYHYDNYEKFSISLLNPPDKFLNRKIFKPFRFAFENRDTTSEGNVFIPGVMRETVSEVFYRNKPKSIKRYIKADVMTGVDNMSVMEMAAYNFDDQNVYDNVLLLANTPFTSPFSNTAIVTYFYYLTDTALIDNRVSYKLHFVGKVKEDIALKGYAWIDSATWGIKSIYFKPNEKANINFVNDYSIKQDFALLKGTNWVLQKEELYSVGSLFKKKNAMSILVKKMMHRENIEAGIEIPDSIFRGPDERILLDTLRINRKPFFDTTRFDPLTPQEEKVWWISDTFQKVPAFKTFQWFSRLLSSAYADAGPFAIGPVMNLVSRNNIEGWRFRFGLETNPRFRYSGWQDRDNFLRKWHAGGYVAYGLKDKDWKYNFATRIALPRKNNLWQTIEFSTSYDIVVPGQDYSSKSITFDNSVNLVSGTVLDKVMKVRNTQIMYEKEFVRGFSSMFIVSEKTFYDIPGVLDFSRERNGEVKRIPQFNVTEFMIDSRYSYRDQYFVSTFWRYFQNSRFPVFMLRYTLGLVDMDREYFTYHNLHLTIRQKLHSRAGYTFYNLRAGKIFGKVPYTSSYMTQGNLGFILNRFNYNLLGQFEFISDQFASLWVEHHFNGFFFNKIPGINKLKLREIIFMKSLVGSFSEKNRSVLMVPDGITSPGPIPYVEMGFGIENIAYVLRVDFLWRLTYRNRAGLPNWGVKFSLTPNF